MTSGRIHNGDYDARRRLHLIDLENLLGFADFRRADAAAAAALYRRIVGVGAADLVVVATCHRQLIEVAGWGPARRLVRSGADGADRALLEVLATEGVVERFEAVAIASGDGIFSTAAAGLQRSGVRVTVVSRPESLSKRLAFAVRDRVAFIDDRCREAAVDLREAA